MKLRNLKPQVAAIQEKADQFNSAYKKLQATQKEADQVAAWMEERYYWGDVLAELRRVLIRSEDDIKKKLSAQRPGVEAGIWIEQMTTMANLQNPATGAGPNPAPVRVLPRTRPEPPNPACHGSNPPPAPLP
jgi:hypothetical protein